MEPRFGFVCLLVGLFTGPASGLQFGHTYGNHMVLQRAPQRAIVYGYADVIGDTVTITLSGHQVGSATVQRSLVNGTTGYWDILLPPESRHGPFVLKASCQDGNVTLVDVMFGDVWVCSGQSNMYFSMRQVNNSAQEIQDALAYTDVRILMSRAHFSAKEQQEATVQIPWEPPRKGIIDYFSAVCFMFGRNLQSHLKYPIGLIATSYGGTKIEAWSSPDSLATCQNSPGKRAVDVNSPSVLWNAMVKPFLKTTIKGAIWYQGESNGPQGYDCMFPEMINDWRNKFHTGSKGQTDSEFPFGFVQLGTYKNLTNGFGFTGTRWAQTADYGYVPNPQMHNTFMAVALDLPDIHSPHGEVHPRYKQDVAARLTLGARAVAYGEQGVVFQGPFPTGFHLDTLHHLLDISFDKGTSHLIFHNTTGFEICCDATPTSGCHGKWAYTTVASHRQSEVTLHASCSHPGYHVIGVRYLWRITPCAFKMCPLYGTTNYLPVPPFIKTGGFSTGTSIVG